MYPKLKDLIAYQQKAKIYDRELSEQIGIEIQTLKKVKKGGSVSTSTVRLIDNFLANPENIEINIEALNKCMQGSVSYTALKIGVSAKTLYTIRGGGRASSSTRKLVKKFIANNL